MPTHYHMTIAGCERDLPICPLNDKLSIGAFVIFGDCELTEACAAELLKRAPEFDYIITAESKGIPLAYEDAAFMKGKKILIVDDVISTGESLAALEKLVEKADGVICGRMAILAEGDAQDREDLIYLEKLPLFDSEGNPLS